MQTANFFDFRGGYCTDVPDDLMANAELKVAENCYWEDGLVKRKGKTTFASFTYPLAGTCRAYVNNAWTTIIALDRTTSTIFVQGASTTFATVTGFTMSGGYDVEMAEMDGKVVCVNGADKPAVLYYDSGYKMENLETYDARERSDLNWYAGSFKSTGTVYTTQEYYFEDHRFGDASASAAFACSDGATNNGFFVACDYTFNKVTLVSCDAFATCTASYKYYTGDGTWATCTMVASVNWAAAAGSKYFEFTYPTNWVVYDEYEGDLTNRYVVRVAFSDPPSSTNGCANLELSHTQYLTQILGGDKPDHVAVHNSRLFMSAGYVVNYAPPNGVTGWRGEEVEYFREGGEKIKALRSCGTFLAVVKERAIYSLQSNGLEGFTKTKHEDYGTISGKSVVNINDALYFLDRDGLRVWDGTDCYPISKHIKTDLDSYTKTNAAAIEYNGNYWISFPSNSITLMFDPDTIRSTDMGDKRVSFYKQKSYRVDEWLYCHDNGYLLGVNNTKIDRCENGVSDASAIDMKIQTKYFSFSGMGDVKHYGRVKPKMMEVSATAGAVHTFTMYSDDGDSSDALTMNVSVGTGNYITYYNVPYKLDGKNLSFHLRHNLAYSSKLIGIAVDYEKRRY